MTKTEAMIGNLKLKECDSILEFLFSDFSTKEACENKATCSTKRQKTQRAKETKGEDVKLKIRASISHEIKNPLNCIISYAELLCKNSSSLQDELKRYVENIQISTMQLKSLLLDVIESAKYEYEKMALKRQNFDTKEKIEDVLRVFEYQFKEKSVTVRCALIQAHITSDIVKFNQILYNLISNAAKYVNANGEIELISWVEEDKFCFEIKNTGTFLKKTEAKRMFRLFQRSESEAVQEKEGFGLGLCVSRQLVEALGGKLEFQGTRKKVAFGFFIPTK